MRGERKGEKDGRKKTAWKARDRKQKKRQEGKAGRLYRPVRDARKTRREKRGPVFRGGWKNICIHPRLPPPLYIGRAIPRYRLRGVSIFRSFASRSDFRTEPLLFLPAFNPLSLSLSFPSLLPLSLLTRQFSLSFSSSSLSLFSLSSSHEDDSHSLTLFFSLAQCASENMNPSSHCLRQRFSNFPPLCANDEGTKGEIKSHPQWVREEASRRRWRWP